MIRILERAGEESGKKWDIRALVGGGEKLSFIKCLLRAKHWAWSLYPLSFIVGRIYTQSTDERPEAQKVSRSDQWWTQVSTDYL